MRKGLTEVVFILDRSGSMSGLESDTIGGFNSMLAKNKQENCQAYVSTVLFDSDCQVLHDRLPLAEIAPMTEKEYYVGGCTALLDAVGGAIQHIKNVHKYARKEDVPVKTLFVIITDGFENSSRKYTYDKVKKMISQQQEEKGWEFIFLGANIDAVQEAARFGISEKRAVRYENDADGIALNFKAVADVVHCCCCSTMVRDDWAEEIAEDYEKRGRK